MKKYVMLVAAMMMSIFIFAQKSEPRHKGQHGQNENMKEVLSLDDAQYASIKDINKKYAAKRHELRTDSALERDKKFQEGKALHQEQQKEVKAVLTPEQNTKWEAYKKERMEKRKANMKEGIEKHDAKLKAELSMTDEQASKMKAARAELGKKMKAQHKDGKTDKEATKNARDTYQSQVKSILDENQFNKWTEMKKEMRKQHNGKKKNHK